MNKLHLMPALAVGLTIGLATALPAQACKDCDDHAAATPATTPAALPGADALAVVRDKETGHLRAPNADEAAAMGQKAQQRRLAAESARVGGRAADAATPLLRAHASGARSVRLTADFSSYAVVVRQADGSLAQRCTDGAEAAIDALKPAAPSSRPLRSAALETQ
jgi:hypothetical protein